ncbi:MAG: L-histidine N(alpha)-methyltransferase [Cytophagales bacterium]|nr:L-histidine N(alpha)-methyltransferase [Rhizobacter sp.]
MLDAARDIIHGLLQPVAAIAPKYFYDARGSTIFEEITRLPEYYPTRTERAIMQRHAADIAQRVGPGRTVIELGAGNCEKARFLCEAIAAARFVAVDISEEFLHQSVDRLKAEMPALEVQAFAADLTAEIVLPADVPQAGRVLFYPGSSIGNFDPPEALGLLTRMRHMLQDDGALLIGVDLRKDVAVLEAAYDDAAGVTAAFNLNVLAHVNLLIGSDFDLSDWQHRAFYNADASRIEMHLEAVADCTVNWPDGERAFARGERIHTENSYKVDIEGFARLLDEAGFHSTVAWTDERRWFAVVLACP